MYNFGVVVDDAFMGITHVLRAQARMKLLTNWDIFVSQFLCVQEHLMNTPRQILMYEALGLKVPSFPLFIPHTASSGTWERNVGMAKE